MFTFKKEISTVLLCLLAFFILILAEGQAYAAQPSAVGHDDSAESSITASHHSDDIQKSKPQMDRLVGVYHHLGTGQNLNVVFQKSPRPFRQD